MRRQVSQFFRVNPLVAVKGTSKWLCSSSNAPSIRLFAAHLWRNHSVDMAGIEENSILASHRWWLCMNSWSSICTRGHIWRHFQRHCAAHGLTCSKICPCDVGEMPLLLGRKMPDGMAHWVFLLFFFCRHFTPQLATGSAGRDDVLSLQLPESAMSWSGGRCCGVGGGLA